MLEWHRVYNSEERGISIALTKNGHMKIESVNKKTNEITYSLYLSDKGYMMTLAKNTKDIETIMYNRENIL